MHPAALTWKSDVGMNAKPSQHDSCVIPQYRHGSVTLLKGGEICGT